MDVPSPQGVFVSPHLKHARILPIISSNSFSSHIAKPLHSLGCGGRDASHWLLTHSMHGKNHPSQPGSNPSTATPPPRYQRGRWDVKWLGLAFFVQSQACRWQSPVYSLAHCNASEMTRCYDPLKRLGSQPMVVELFDDYEPSINIWVLCLLSCWMVSCFHAFR